MNRALALSALALAACGPSSEESLISDAELDSIVSTRQGLVATQPEATPTPGAIHVRLAWGYLAGRRNAPGWINWTGGAGVDSGGQVSLESLNYFDRHDRPVSSEDAGRVQWSSRTLPHFDGAVVKVTPAAGSTGLRFQTPPYARELSLADLAAGVNERVVVDAAGHEVSISSVPDLGCGGFSFGYMKPSSEGWLGFAGLFTDEHGAVTARLRFRADGEAITARVIGSDGSHPYQLDVQGPVLATGQGLLDAAAETFEISLVKEDGSPAGKVSGSYAEPSYSPRGSYQAVVGCP